MTGPSSWSSATSIATVNESLRMGHVLVLCPNTLKSWWAQEIERWDCYHNKITVLNSASRDIDLKLYADRGGWLIMNWEQLYSTVQDLGRYYFDWVIGDEAHRIKNRQTKMFRAARGLSSKNMLMVTGTPVGNEPAELWALLTLTYPEIYPSYWRYYEMYTQYGIVWKGRRRFESVKNEEIMRRSLVPVMLRRHKKDVLKDLPDKTYKTIPIQMTKKQYAMYVDMAKKSLIELLNGMQIEAVNYISLMMRLRQILSTTATLDPLTAEESGKLDAVMDYIQDSGKEKIVVFVQFRATVEALHARLTTAKIKYITIWGGMTTDEVARSVDTFQRDSDVQIAVCTLQAGGVGITLTAAHTAIFVEKHYNPSIQIQAEDRIHRIGQKDNVLIITILAKDTVDEIVENIIAGKITMTEAVLRPVLLQHLRGVAP